MSYDYESDQRAARETAEVESWTRDPRRYAEIELREAIRKRDKAARKLREARKRALYTPAMLDYLRTVLDLRRRTVRRVRRELRRCEAAEGR